MENSKYKIAIWMRITGRVISLLVAGFFLAFLVGGAIDEALSEEVEAIEVAGIILAILVVVALAGSILSWWRERLAGILLVLVSIGLGIHIGIYAGRNYFLAWSMVGLPYLVAGGLLLYAWWLDEKTV